MLSTLRSLMAPAVTGPVEVLELLLPLPVVLLEMVVDGAGVVCEPAPDPVEDPADVGELLDDWPELALGDAVELAVSEAVELLEVREAEGEVVSDSNGTDVVEAPSVPLPVLEVMPAELVGLADSEELAVDVDEGAVELVSEVELDAVELASELVDSVDEEAIELVSLEEDDVVDSVGVTTEAVVADTCDVVTSVDVPVWSAAGLELAGDVAFVASQKSVNCSSWVSRYERSVILLVAPFASMQESQVVRSDW